MKIFKKDNEIKDAGFYRGFSIRRLTIGSCCSVDGVEISIGNGELQDGGVSIILDKETAKRFCNGLQRNIKAYEEDYENKF